MNEFAQNFEEDLNKDESKPKNSIDFVRHSVSSYQSYVDKVASENPMGALDYNNQSTPDLPENGIELARSSAERFFENLDPQKDVLFFASSNEARAVETANIYRQIAHSKGFKVIKPENARSVLSEEISDGEIRVLKNLGIRSSGVIDSVFQSPNKRVFINWGAMDPDLKKRFDEASKIIEANDKGSFGANLATHSEEVKKIFPEIFTAKEQFDIQFRNLVKLMKFAFNKTSEPESEEQIKILAFGHENYMMYALEHYFKEEGIKNCETMHIEPQDEGVKITFRDKETEIK